MTKKKDITIPTVELVMISGALLFMGAIFGALLLLFMVMVLFLILAVSVFLFLALGPISVSKERMNKYLGLCFFFFFIGIGIGILYQQSSSQMRAIPSPIPSTYQGTVQAIYTNLKGPADSIITFTSGMMWQGNISKVANLSIGADCTLVQKGILQAFTSGTCKVVK